MCNPKEIRELIEIGQNLNDRMIALLKKAIEDGYLVKIKSEQDHGI